jgi:HD superfamily phosphohydrolase
MDESIMRSDSNMIIHDVIHGSYGLPNIAWKIIDTPIFQRLRCIKQTGNTFYVYPGAEHTRFQHSLGVAYLSLEFGKAIKSQYPEYIDNHQILLLCLAGLCHDLGHCAYSHLYDNNIIPLFKMEQLDQNQGISTHEEASYLLLKKLWQDIPELNTKLSECDVHTIGKMIIGAEHKVPDTLQELKWSASDRTNQFLFEIVSNDRTGIDVDKFDYLKRDSHYTGVPCTFDPQRLMAFFVIVEQDSILCLEYQKKARELINAMWIARDDLHRRVYQHRVVKCIDLMTIDIIMLCKDVPFHGKPLKEAHCDLDTYIKLTDLSIITLAEQVPEAQALVNRIQHRDLWDSLAVVSSSTELNMHFSDPFVRISLSHFSDEYVYYIFYASKTPIDPLFFLDLIVQTKGGSIKIREKSYQIRDIISKTTVES